VTVAVVTALVGIAIDRGEIESLDQPVTDHVPELLDRDERFADVTLRHLVTMSSGLAYEEQGLPWSHDATTCYAPTCEPRRSTRRSRASPGAPGTTTTSTRC